VFTAFVHPFAFVNVYVNVTVPAFSPVINPFPGLIVAIVLSELVHVPVAVVLASVVVEP